MTAIPSLMAAWFNGLPFKSIALVATVGLAALGLLTVYREGRHSAERAAAIDLARHNAEIAAKYMRDVKAAEDIAAREQARAETLAGEVSALKEQVRNAAKGDASPGVDAAVHGMRAPSPALGRRAVPGPPL